MRLVLVGLAHVVLLPFLLLFMVVYFFLQNAQEWHSSKVRLMLSLLFVVGSGGGVAVIVGVVVVFVFLCMFYCYFSWCSGGERTFARGVPK